MTPQFIDDLSVKEEDFVYLPLVEKTPPPKFIVPRGHYLMNLSKGKKRKEWSNEEISDIFILLRKPNLYRRIKRLWTKMKNLFS